MPMVRVIYTDRDKDRFENGGELENPHNYGFDTVHEAENFIGGVEEGEDGDIISDVALFDLNDAESEADDAGEATKPDQPSFAGQEAAATDGDIDEPYGVRYTRGEEALAETFSLEENRDAFKQGLDVAAELPGADAYPIADSDEETEDDENHDDE